MSTTAKPPKTKKTSSFLGTLFTKEPSTDAFVQMQNQSRKQMAQNPGRKYPPGMAGVSSVKMPENVPKVNSKWNGLPQRGDEEYYRRDSRTSSRGSSTRTSSTCARSADPSGRENYSRRPSDLTTSSTHPNHGRRKDSAHQHASHAGREKVITRAESLASSNSIKHLRPKSISIRTKSLSSPSGGSLQQIKPFFANDIPEPTGVSQGYRIHSLSMESAKIFSEDNGAKDITFLEDHLGIASLNHASSPRSTPLEQLPNTPFSEPIQAQHLGGLVVEADDYLSLPRLDGKATDLVLRSWGSDVSDHSSTTSKVSDESVRASLAEEARPIPPPYKGDESLTPKPILKNGSRGQVFAPTVQIQRDLEKRPDSSRARLGLRASIIKDPDAVPWDWNKGKSTCSEPPTRTAPPKTVFPKPLTLGIFSKA